MKKKTKRKVKYVVWLHNFTDSRDDEWVAVWAKSIGEAQKLAQYDMARFFKGRVYTAAEFRQMMGMAA